MVNERNAEANSWEQVPGGIHGQKNPQKKSTTRVQPVCKQATHTLTDPGNQPRTKDPIKARTLQETGNAQEYKS